MTTIVPNPGRVIHMAQVIGALKIEVATGLRHSRGSVMNLARDMYGCTKRTKKGVLAEMMALYREETGREYGSP